MILQSVISVDVEDYFHVEAFANVVNRADWESYPSRVEANTRRVLDLFDECGVRGTYFILGWVAERYPALVREIAGRGHELGCHSYWHRLIYKLSPEEFRQDTVRAKNLIEQAAGVSVQGYRSPTFSITRKSLWAFDVLAETGFSYDSSVFPVRHDVYGIPDAPRAPFVVQTPSGPIVEYPMTTFRFRGSGNLPVGGGGYLRIFPYWYTRLGVERAWREGIPIVSYIHPWELDPHQPRLNASLKSRLRHYTNLSGMENHFRELIRMGPFSSFRESGLERLARVHDLKERQECPKKTP